MMIAESERAACVQKLQPQHLNGMNQLTHQQYETRDSSQPQGQAPAPDEVVCANIDCISNYNSTNCPKLH